MLGYGIMSTGGKTTPSPIFFSKIREGVSVLDREAQNWPISEIFVFLFYTMLIRFYKIILSFQLAKNFFVISNMYLPT